MTHALKLFALSAAIIVGGLSVADAKGGGHRGERASFETLDTDGDGQITKAEIEARGADRFASVDTDGNGELSKDELIAQSAERQAQRVDKMLERLDADENGTLSQAELEAAPRRGGGDRLFKRADADENGSISKEEFETAMEKRGGRDKKRKSE